MCLEEKKHGLPFPAVLFILKSIPSAPGGKKSYNDDEKGELLVQGDICFLVMQNARLSDLGLPRPFRAHRA